MNYLNRLLGKGVAATVPVRHDTVFVETADEADIRACFRLILGRLPNREEWPGHVMHVGENLASVVESFLSSLEFEQRGLGVRHMSADAVLTRLGDFSIFSSPDDSAVGKHVRTDNYEKDVEAVFRAHLKPGMHVLDIGANIGYFSMLSASLVGPSGAVLAIEPNARNVKLLEASRRANGFDNITVCQVAAGREAGILVLNTAYSNGTTSGLPDEVRKLLAADTVPSIPLDMLTVGRPPVDFIKIDVEGAEYNALTGGRNLIARDRPVIVSEFSPTMMPGISGVSGADYLSWLTGFGYGISAVEPDGTLSAHGSDIQAILAVCERRQSDHIDIVATVPE